IIVKKRPSPIKLNIIRNLCYHILQIYRTFLSSYLLLLTYHLNKYLILIILEVIYDRNRDLETKLNKLCFSTGLSILAILKILDNLFLAVYSIINEFRRNYCSNNYQRCSVVAATYKLYKLMFVIFSCFGLLLLLVSFGKSYGEILPALQCITSTYDLFFYTLILLALFLEICFYSFVIFTSLMDVLFLPLSLLYKLRKIVNGLDFRYLIHSGFVLCINYTTIPAVYSFLVLNCLIYLTFLYGTSFFLGTEKFSFKKYTPVFFFFLGGPSPSWDIVPTFIHSFITFGLLGPHNIVSYFGGWGPLLISHFLYDDD
ncbi:hypothetical protein L9F63_011804, partial [Diploptera punctata]